MNLKGVSMATKKKKKNGSFQLSADFQRLCEIANVPFKTTKEAKDFFKGMVYTAIAEWMKSDEKRTTEDEIILIDTLAVLGYVIL
ncbi:MAG TPA: hypothetical protein VI911_10550 [Patescibacteria group bacterium]|nr:hypothetical protein [Patescibacteria group bacterium]